MSSWNSKIHFRERKMPSAAPATRPPESNPSKYFIPKGVPNDAVVCSIALDEEPYIDEWIKYNIALGFSHIYIYDNSKTNVLKDKQSDVVSVIPFPGPVKQLQAYDIFTAQYKKSHKWAAFIDCDEFIVLKKHTNIVDFLKEYDEYSGVGINWLMFGTSHQKNHTNEPVTYRFRYCNKTADRHYRSIVKINTIEVYVSPHYPLLRVGHICNTDREKLTGPFNDDLNSDIAVIHHYYTKSEEELLKKLKRPRPDCDEKRDDTIFELLCSMYNDVPNSDAWDFYSKHL